jgi:hypothetical protein
MEHVKSLPVRLTRSFLLLSLFRNRMTTTRNRNCGLWAARRVLGEGVDSEWERKSEREGGSREIIKLTLIVLDE